MLIGRGDRILNVEPADPVIELPRQARQSSGWYAKQCVDFVRRQLNAELETGAGWVPKEVSPETGVRQQATERAFHVPLTHASCPEQGSHQVSCSRGDGGIGAASHVNVRIHT
jgi:hypothetical protein